MIDDDEFQEFDQDTWQPNAGVQALEGEMWEENWDSVVENPLVEVRSHDCCVSLS